MQFTIAIAVAPALLLLWLFKKWDEKRPEPAGAVPIVVVFGMISCVPAGIIELLESAALGESLVKMQGGFLNAFFIAALTEEVVKLAVVLLWLWRKPHFDEVMDGILYTAAASLGFALLENVLYSHGSIATGVVRAFTAVPLHATCSGIMGYCVGRAKLASMKPPAVGVPLDPSGYRAPNASAGSSIAGQGSTMGWLLTGLGIAVFIHGLYDWVVFSGGGFGFMEPNVVFGLLGILPIVAICAVILRMLVKHAQKLDDDHHGSMPRPLVDPSKQPMQPAFAGPQPGWQQAPFPPQPYAPPGYPQQPYPQYPPQPYPQYPQQQYPQYPQQQYPQYPQQPQQPPQQHPGGYAPVPPTQGGPFPPGQGNRGGQGWGQ